MNEDGQKARLVVARDLADSNIAGAGEKESTGAYDDAFVMYAVAAAEDLSSGTAYEGLARMAYFKKWWDKCIEWTETSFMLSGKPKSASPYVYYSVALMNWNRQEDALKVCDEGLALEPENPYLKGNKEQLEKMKAPVPDRRIQIIKPKSMDGTGKHSTIFDLSVDLEAKSIHAPPDIFSAYAIQMWKRHVEAGRFDKAMALLEALPVEEMYERLIDEAKEKTRALTGLA
jgi:tetratricopeptide (TPR) repeat protein